MSNIINLINCSECKIEFDSGFYFGKGLFETILVKNGYPVLYKEHLERLKKGLESLSIDSYVDKDMLFENIKECKDGAVKIMVSEKNIIFSRRDVPYKNEHYEKGFSLCISDIKRNESSPLVYLKSLNYMENILENEKCKKLGFDEVIFLNTRDEIAEGSVSNIFFIMEDEIITPKVECGILDGVVRRALIDNFGEKYCIKEELITLEKLDECKGVFITNSLMGLMWVNNFNSRHEKHRVYEKLRDDYENYINSMER